MLALVHSGKSYYSLQVFLYVVGVEREAPFSTLFGVVCSVSYDLFEKISFKKT